MVSTAEKPRLEYGGDIRPILSKNCCHGQDGEKQMPSLRLGSFEGATADHAGRAALVPGKPDTSGIHQRIALERPNPTAAPGPAAAPGIGRRRVSLDLVGLPPLPNGLDAFLKNVKGHGEAAYAAAVDPRLASLMFVALEGEKLYYQRAFAAAETELRRALVSRPKDARVRLFLAKTLIELGRVPEAMAELERALESTDPEIRFQAGKIAREMAERRFAELERLAPDSASVHELSGRNFELSGKLPEALREYNSAIAKEPSRPGLHYEAGNVLWRMREVDAAARELQAELLRTPDHGMANLRLGQVYIARNDEASALPLLERALKAMPESDEARRDLGKVYRKLNRLGEARALWETLAKLRPNDDQVHYLLGNLYRQLGEQALARRELARHREILERRSKRD